MVHKQSEEISKTAVPHQLGSGSSAATLPQATAEPCRGVHQELPAAHSKAYSRTTLSLPATARCVRQASTLCMPTGRGGPPCDSVH